MIEFLREVLAWYTDPAQWTGRDTLPELIFGQVLLAASALAVASALGQPNGRDIGHTARGAGGAVGMSNIARAIPTHGGLGLGYPNTTANQQRAPETKEQLMATLKQLGELKAAGVLTEAEFDTKKKEILARL